jgi:hypothetical protein
MVRPTLYRNFENDCISQVNNDTKPCITPTISNVVTTTATVINYEFNNSIKSLNSLLFACFINSPIRN